MHGSLKRARITLMCGQWFLIAGLVFFSLMTSTPLVDAHNQWKGYGWVLGLMTDAAFIMSLQAESTLARFGVKAAGPWPAIFRWTTGIATVFLNTWHSISRGDWVGVAIHLITPALVLLLAEVGPIFMRHLVEAEGNLTERQPAVEVRAPEPAPLPPVEAVNAFLTDDMVQALEQFDEPPAVQQDAQQESEDDAARLSMAEAHKIIEEGWRYGLDVDEVAKAATRHRATVLRAYAKLDATKNAQREAVAA